MPERFVVHLPVVAGDLAGPVRLARVIARWSRMLASADPGETTVSAGDEQGVRHRVFGDLRMVGGRRCLLRVDHDGPCARRVTGRYARP
ncbi:hypothetical protein ACH495_05375 [Micromonospora sp. NPDC018662]|uniref:hypothetical protein n=1 Tax=Micromonospora sp. NPDC018662 TaxID=3364238 RepID=UPI003796E0E2